MKQAGRYIFLLLLCFYCLAVPKFFAQTIEQAYDLRFQKGMGFLRFVPYRFTIDSTELTEDGFYPLRLKYDNIFSKPSTLAGYPLSDDCRLFSSVTVVLPPNEKKECCTVTLNYKSEIEGLRFVVIARDRKENALYTDTVILPAADRWTDYSFKFCKAEARAVSIVISREGCDEAYQGRSIYLNKISIRLGNQELNNLPLASLVYGDTQLKSKAIVPLSFEDDASLAGIHDWKDKKIIALGESMGSLQDIREVQVQLMKHLITSENCRLIMLELSQSMCFLWNLYLQGKLPDDYGDKLLAELKKQVYSPAIFFEFMQWVRQYNAKATHPVRIAGIAEKYDEGYLAGLLSFLTNRQDSVSYLKALQQGKYLDIKEYILQSQLSKVLNKQDFQYLLYLIKDLERMRFLDRKFILREIPKDSIPNKAERVERIVDIYLSQVEKAVIIAYSGRINKRGSIYDAGVKSSQVGNDSLGYHLYQRYGKQYHAVSIQIGERTCLADTSINYYKEKDPRWISPVRWKPPFPFAFEHAAMESGIPYLYYPSNQLPDGICGLNMFNRFSDGIPFCYCHIPSQFDALVFIREAKAPRDSETDYYSRIGEYGGGSYSDYPNIDKLLKELGE